MCHLFLSLFLSLSSSLSSAVPSSGVPDFEQSYGTPLSDDDSVNGLSVTHFTMEDSKATGVEYFCASDARSVCVWCVCVRACVRACVREVVHCVNESRSSCVCSITYTCCGCSEMIRERLLVMCFLCMNLCQTYLSCGCC